MSVSASSTYTCCVLGLGYIGLPTAAVLANAGHRVLGVDVNTNVVSTVNAGQIHIVEPDLADAVASAVATGSLTASLNPSPADVFIIAVPTPFTASRDSIPQPNIDFVLAAVRSIVPVIRPGNLLLLESTSPVGTTDKISQIIAEEAHLQKEDVHVAYCPERVLPGQILRELKGNDRVIGGVTPAATEVGIKFYETFCDGNLLATNARTAELVKLSENSFRDVNIAFANELSLVCDHLNVDVRELIRLANHHPRVNILNPGCGVGGHCIAVDPWFIAAAVPHRTPLIQCARNVNEGKSSWVIEQVIKQAGELQTNLGHPIKVGCFGLAFKPNVDDLRESPALHVVEKLLETDLHILSCEPNIDEHPTISLSTVAEVLDQSDLLVFLVSHSQFKNLDLSGRVIFDLCGVTQECFGV